MKLTSTAPRHTRVEVDSPVVTIRSKDIMTEAPARANEFRQIAEEAASDSSISSGLIKAKPKVIEPASTSSSSFSTGPSRENEKKKVKIKWVPRTTANGRRIAKNKKQAAQRAYNENEKRSSVVSATSMVSARSDSGVSEAHKG